MYNLKVTYDNGSIPIDDKFSNNNTFADEVGI